jgi:hypothetical protein
MTVPRLLSLIIAIAVIAGCSDKMRVQSDFDKAADFEPYKMWDWLPGDPGVTENLMVDDENVHKRIEDAIDEGFRNIGYDRTSGAPDFFVKYYLGYGEEINKRNIENYYAYLNYSVFVPTVTQSYTEVWETGTMIIDVIDAEQKKLVWRGTAVTEVNPQAGPRENEPKLKKAIKMMLEKFPPK